MADEFLTTGQAAILLGCSASTVRRMVASGVIPHAGQLPGKNGPFILRRADVYSYLASRTERSTA